MPWQSGPVDPWTPPVTGGTYYPIDTSGYVYGDTYTPVAYATGYTGQQLAVTGGPAFALLPAAGTALAATGGVLVARRKLGKAMGFGRVAAKHSA